MRFLIQFCFIFLPFFAFSQKTWHFGAAYSFGGAWNFHTTNSTPARPSDVSNLGFIARLENDGKSLGFQAGVHMRWNEVRNHLRDNYYLDNSFSALELRLQLVLPLSSKSSVAMGLAPRMVLRNNFSIVYSSRSNGSQAESELEIPDSNADLNELNSSLVFSYQYRLHKRWHFFLNVESDIQPVYAENVKFENYDLSLNNEPEVSINSLLTSVSGSIVFWLK